jgi:hypothetical protein
MYSVMSMAKSHLKTKCAVSLRFDVAGNTKGGKYHCTIDLLFDWFGISCMTTDNLKKKKKKKNNQSQSNRRSTIQYSVGVDILAFLGFVLF